MASSGTAGPNSAPSRPASGASEAVRIIGFVGRQVGAGKAVDQVLGLDAVMDLAPGKDRAKGIAEAVDGDVDLAARAAA